MSRIGALIELPSNCAGVHEPKRRADLNFSIANSLFYSKPAITQGYDFTEHH